MCIKPRGQRVAHPTLALAGAGISGFIGASTSNQSRSDGWYSEVCASGKVGVAIGGCVGSNLSRNTPLIHSMKVGAGIGLTPVDANANIGYQITLKPQNK